MSTPGFQTDAKRRYTVLSRIQGLLTPQQDSAPFFRDRLDASPHNYTPAGQGRRLDAKFLKVRVVTWNMHDSLPKGDLQNLFGKVPQYNDSSTNPGQFPPLANDTNHPFHLVVVAGQECPTPSGIPMGLGAGFKIGEKDREKLKNGVHDEVEISEKEETRDINAYDKALAGWTQQVEDWLCHGLGSKTGSPSSAEIGTPKPLIRQRTCREPRRRPYQLLIKDRLMGIYLALYIHRDLKPLVQGMSKASVTAGLIGGRIGNKGGVGISLQLDGTTFLFLNAHLAAHEGKVNHRLANLSKIKTELAVDTFLANDDARTVAEDLTDKFDFTFLFGDLNFRLDISRLHADWLISRQEYAQALEFDQLKAIMRKGGAFDGFHEAPIDFAPTFKYDVSRRSKHRKRLCPGDQSPVPQTGVRQAEMAEDDIDEGADLVSLSSVTTDNSRTLSESEYFRVLPSNSAIASSNVGNGGNGKVKPRWLSLLSPSFATSPKSSKFQTMLPSQVGTMRPTSPKTASCTSPEFATTPKTAKFMKQRFLRQPPMINLSVSQNTIQDEPDEEEKGVYDTSSKKRVPSWCDRILWKTTISRLSPVEPFDLSPQSRRTTRRVSQFFQALRSPSSRTAALETHGHWTSPFSDQTPLSSPMIDSDTQRNSRARSAIAPNFKPDWLPASRRTSSAFSPPPTAPLPSQISPRHPSHGDQPRSASGSIWRFLPAFLSPNYTSSEDCQVSSSPIHVRGDIVCLSYKTLDDGEMRRLEGRSDHRPVIGEYAVYL